MRWTRVVVVGVAASSVIVLSGGVGSRRAGAQDVQAEQEITATSIGGTGTSSFIVSRATEKIRAGRNTFRGIWTHSNEARRAAGLHPVKQGGFYHDGRFATLLDVVNHYNTVLDLALTDAEKRDIVEYVKSLH